MNNEFYEITHNK